jgi:hypothetical protein
MKNIESHFQIKGEFLPLRQTDGITQIKYRVTKGNGMIPRIYGFSIFSQSTVIPKTMRIMTKVPIYPPTDNIQNACHSGLLP